MKRIIWFSRHNPLPSQKEELKRIFGEMELLIDTQPFSDVTDVVNRFNLANADEMVVVAPLSVIYRLCQRGIKPLFAEMEVVYEGSYDVVAVGRKYKFKNFSRIREIKIVKEQL